MKKTIETEIELDRLHDAIVDVFWQDDVDTSNITDDQLEKVFDKLPSHIQGIAIQWGGGDTVFGDEAYVYIQDNKEIFMGICGFVKEGAKNAD